MLQHRGRRKILVGGNVHILELYLAEELTAHIDDVLANFAALKLQRQYCIKHPYFIALVRPVPTFSEQNQLVAVLR